MNAKPLVTIVIPVYNGTNFMREAIDCALQQSYDNIEIIVVNDGSTDDGATERAARAYGEKIRYLSKENGGVSSALNLAIATMRGDWFSWLSHDDLYYPDKIERQIAFINALMEKEPGLDVNKIAIHTATESIDRDGKVIKTPSYRDVPEKEKSIDVIINNVYNYRLSGCSFLIPRAAFKELGGFREDLRTVSDVEFWYRLLFAGFQFYCMSNDILVRNRSHGRQIEKTRVSLFERELEALHISIADRMAENEAFNTVGNFKKYYYGLVKRRLATAADYTRETYIRRRVSALEYAAFMPVKALAWTALGEGRALARDIFRAIHVR